MNLAQAGDGKFDCRMNFLMRMLRLVNLSITFLSQERAL